MTIDTVPVQQLKQLWQQAFDEPLESIDRFFETGFSPDRCQYTQLDGKVVSALYWFDCTWNSEPVAYIYALATDKAYRGQGLASALLRNTHQLLAQQGYRGVALKPADGLIPYYEGLGYTVSGYVSRDTVAASTVPVPVKELSAANYAARRRQHLPKNSLLIEGPALDYLHTYARFWEGPQCVFCTGRYEAAVYEFLGDSSDLPSVLSALQIPTAAPVCPGGEIPFLMYYPLTPAVDGMPTYLGLSLE